MVDNMSRSRETPREMLVGITVWSDYVCPFCYLQEPVLSRIQEEFGPAVEVNWRPFELHPEPIPTLDPNGSYLHTVWNGAVYPMADERGMILRLPPVQPRSRKALEAAEFARDRGRFAEMRHGLFRAFFEDGKDLGALDVLMDIGGGAGLDPEQVRQALDGGEYTDRVVRSQEEAYALGVDAVPAALIGLVGRPLQEAELVSGAQPFPIVRVAVERALRPTSSRSPRNAASLAP